MTLPRHEGDFGIEHLLTAPRHPTTTGKIERFHRLRAEFDTRRVFTSQQEKLARLGESNPYAERDAGYLSALEWSSKVVTSNGPPG